MGVFAQSLCRSGSFTLSRIGRRVTCVIIVNIVACGSDPTDSARYWTTAVTSPPASTNRGIRQCEEERGGGRPTRVQTRRLMASPSPTDYKVIKSQRKKKPATKSTSNLHLEKSSILKVDVNVDFFPPTRTWPILNDEDRPCWRLFLAVPGRRPCQPDLQDLY